MSDFVDDDFNWRGWTVNGKYGEENLFLLKRDVRKSMLAVHILKEVAVSGPLSFYELGLAMEDLRGECSWTGAFNVISADIVRDGYLGLKKAGFMERTRSYRNIEALKSTRGGENIRNNQPSYQITEEGITYLENVQASVFYHLCSHGSVASYKSLEEVKDCYRLLAYLRDEEVGSIRQIYENVFSIGREMDYEKLKALVEKLFVCGFCARDSAGSSRGIEYCLVEKGVRELCAIEKTLGDNWDI